ADADAGVGLGHRRLAIQDLTHEGHQPMHSADGRYVLIFNGEIYNFLELMHELEKRGHVFRGHSDTEVMLAVFTECGIEAAVKCFLGMFAFALWDRHERELHLVRDRAGEKPLYYGWSGGVFLFGSELKALRAHPRWEGELDREALTLFLRHNYIPAPHSIYRHISKLAPGSILTLTARDFETRQTPAPKAYWSLSSAAQAGLANPFPGSAQEATEYLRELLRQAVTMQMVADVPIGAFLSGGIDSSTVVATMQAHSPRPIKTFSIGFGEAAHDEAPFAKAVASHLGTQHTELYVHAGALQQTIPRLATIYDEPLADTSHIPTVLLCELARKQVTVCLSGDAGDELFGGYAHYQKTQKVWKIIQTIPVSQRQRLAKLLSRTARRGIELQHEIGWEPGFFKRLLRLSELLPVISDEALYKLLISPCRDPQDWLTEAKEPAGNNGFSSSWSDLPRLLQRMMYWDFVRYLPDEILAKVDRAAMSVSLETRIPLLDYRIIEFAWSLPDSFKQRRGKGKWILRQLLHQYVPPGLVERPKKGFAAPVEDWIRGELRPWAEELLSKNRLRQDGFFQEQIVRKKWAEHLARTRDWGRPLWNVLMFQGWLESHKSQTTRRAGTVPSPQVVRANPELVAR
ncbi:MAG: asparagine synthase (glutamine-hydrolyzing), partial [Verrucomicrobia bacterium]